MDQKASSSDQDYSYDPKLSEHDSGDISSRQAGYGSPKGAHANEASRHKAYGRQISFRRIGKLYLLKLLRLAPDRWIELALTAAIMIVAAVQLFTTISNNAGTTQQTEQLIQAAKISAYAADRNAQAASSFAEAARGINQGVSDAVGRLQTQANVTEAARETAAADTKATLDATIDNFHRDQRAWVGIDSAEGFPEPDKPWSVVITFKNTGKTPARSAINLVMYQIIPLGHRIPFDDALRDRYRASQNLIVPGGTETSTTKITFPAAKEDIEGWKSPNSPVRFYGFGEAQYVDVFNVSHVTKFCFFLRWMNDHFAYTACEEHNDAT